MMAKAAKVEPKPTYHEAERPELLAFPTSQLKTLAKDGATVAQLKAIGFKSKAEFETECNRRFVLNKPFKAWKRAQNAASKAAAAA